MELPTGPPHSLTPLPLRSRSEHGPPWLGYHMPDSKQRRMGACHNNMGASAWPMVGQTRANLYAEMNEVDGKGLHCRFEIEKLIINIYYWLSHYILG